MTKSGQNFICNSRFPSTNAAIQRHTGALAGSVFTQNSITCWISNSWGLYKCLPFMCYPCPTFLSLWLDWWYDTIWCWVWYLWLYPSIWLCIYQHIYPLLEPSSTHCLAGYISVTATDGASVVCRIQACHEAEGFTDTIELSIKMTLLPEFWGQILCRCKSIHQGCAMPQCLGWHLAKSQWPSSTSPQKCILLPPACWETLSLPAIPRHCNPWIVTFRLDYCNSLCLKLNVKMIQRL